MTHRYRYDKLSKCPCPHCGYTQNTRVRRNIAEYCLSSVIPIRVYQCGNCHQRFIKPNFQKIKTTANA